MKSALVFTLALVVSCGSVEWRDFRAGNVKLPISEEDAVTAGWKSVDTDSSLKLTWFTQKNDPRFMLGFDGRQKLAGLRVAFLKSEVDPEYVSVYVKSGLFEEKKFNGKDVYYSTVLFTPDTVLRSGGRRSLPDDEIALGIHLKRHDKFKPIARDACELAQGAVVEQACKSGYGLVFSKFGSKSTCDSLIPFYVIYDPQGSGNLIGFGWLSFRSYSTAGKNNPFYKTLSASQFKTLFPNAPACMSSFSNSKGLIAVDVWLSYESGQQTHCSGGSNWVTSHCQRKRNTRPDEFGTARKDFVDYEVK